jgi:hypothetical protein
MECGGAGYQMPSLFPIQWVAAADGRLDGLSRHAERLVGVESLVRGSIPICVAKLQREGQDAVPEVEQIGRQICRELLRALRHDAFAPHHAPRQTSRGDNYTSELLARNHLLRLIDCYVDFSFVRERLKGFYSATGRPSIDPEVLLRLLVVGYL